MCYCTEIQCMAGLNFYTEQFYILQPAITICHSLCFQHVVYCADIHLTFSAHEGTLHLQPQFERHTMTPLQSMTTLYMLCLHQQEHAIKSSEENLHRLNILLTHLGYQQESIQRSAHALENVKEQVQYQVTQFLSALHLSFQFVLFFLGQEISFKISCLPLLHSDLIPHN